MSNKYPVVVCNLDTGRGYRYLIDGCCRTTNTMRLSSVPEERVSELHLGLPRLVSTLRVYQSSSPREVIQSPHRAVSMLPSETCMRTIGGGTCTIRSRDRIGSETKMPSIT